MFNSGITNTLVSLYLKEKGLASSGGEISEKIIDRSEELYSMQLLHKAGLGPPIHAQLSNGLCYGFLPGKDGIGGGAVGGNLAEGGWCDGRSAFSGDTRVLPKI